MEKLKLWIRTGKNKYIAAVLVVVFLIGASYGIASSGLFNEKSRVGFRDGIIFEYGEDLSTVDLEERLVNKSLSNYESLEININSIDTLQVAEEKVYQIEVLLDGEYTDVDISYAVYDTQVPILAVQDIEIQQGNQIDYSVIKATDPVDGDLIVDILEPEDLDTGVVGTYELIAKAADQHGNDAQATFLVAVVSKEVVENSPQSDEQTSSSSASGSNQGSSNSTVPSTGGKVSSKPATPSTQDPPIEQKYACATAHRDKNQPCDAMITASHNDPYIHGRYKTMDLCKVAGDSILTTTVKGYLIERYFCTEYNLNDPNQGTWFGLSLIHIDDSSNGYNLLIDGRLVPEF